MDADLSVERPVPAVDPSAAYGLGAFGNLVASGENLVAGPVVGAAAALDPYGPSIDGVAMSVQGTGTPPGALAGRVLAGARSLIGLAAELRAAKTAAPVVGGLTPNQVGKVGEDAVRAVYDIGAKTTISINGVTRVPDGLYQPAEFMTHEPIVGGRWT
ncbi:hypothetical protein ACFW16_35850 [Inquilinus sp. NPDC058860]|uniref:hypothetical protein n=1 Tax=Inquilinus sp. NPDC058860 TaxID=3346652 RepID=UPI003688005E